MAVTRDNILKVCPNASIYVDELLRQMEAAGITGGKRASHFLGQIMVESNGFRSLVESLNYSVTGLLITFSRARISKEKAEELGRKSGEKSVPNDRQKAIADLVYGGSWGRQNLGNLVDGDGWKFRGRGLKQLTGRDNYLRFSQEWLGNDALLANPDRVSDPSGAVASAVWFWGNKKLNAVADRDSVTEVTRIVNGGENGLEDRRKWTAEFKRAFA